MTTHRWQVALLLVASASVSSACVDVRAFEGRWQGGIVGEQAVRQGFTVETEVQPLELANVTLQGLSATLSTTDGRFSHTPLTRVSKAASDALASLSFDGDPLRSYLMFASPADEAAAAPAMMVVSLFGDSHVELRVIRGNDLFGVFYLVRAE